MAATAERRPPRAARVAAWTALASLPIAVWLVVHGLQDHYRFGDEAISVYGGRQVIGDFPHALWDPSFSHRPLERLLAWVWAANLEVMPTTADAFVSQHVVLAIVAASAAIPVALLLRGLGTPTRWAVAGGVLAILGPWSIFGVTLLNNAPGMTAFAWAFLAAQRVVRVPGWRSDLLFLAAALVVGLVRAGNLPLVAGVAPAILWAAWERGGGPVGFARELVRRHWLLLLAAAGAALILAARGFDGLFGAYGAGRSTYLPWDVLWVGLGHLGGHIAIATGVVALAFALPWIVRAVVRPATAAERSFAVGALGVAVLFAYVYAPALNEDRYFFVLTPLVVVPFVHALAVRRLGLPWIAAGAALLGFLLLRGTDWPQSSDAWVQVPAAQWWNHVVEGRLQALPGSPDAWGALGAAACALVAGALLVRGSARVRRLVPAVVLGVVLLHQAISGVYVIDHWIDERARPGLTFEQLAFADEAMPEGGSAMLLRANPQGDEYLPFSWDDVSFWNQRVAGTIDVTPQQPCCVGGNYHLQWDDRTGRAAIEIPFPTPYVVTPRRPAAAFAGETLVSEPTQGYRLDSIASPARLSYVVTAAEPRRVELVAWPRTLGDGGGSCLSGELQGVTTVTVDGRAVTPVADGDGERALVALPDRRRVVVELEHFSKKEPSDLRLERCTTEVAGR